MHDLKSILNHPEDFTRRLGRRGVQPDTAGIINLEERRRQLVAATDELRRRRNELSQQIARLKHSGADTVDQESQSRSLGDQIARSEADLRDLERRLTVALQALPNLPDDDVPDGADTAANREVRRWGDLPRFDFPPQDHLEVAERLNILDFKRGGKIAGSGFPVWCGHGARLERALLNLMLDLHTRRHNYREMMTPFLANYSSMLASGQIPKLEDDMYRCRRLEKTADPEDDLFLIPTSEVTLVNLHRDEVIPESQLPLKYTAYSPCFRREAGAYGQMTRGFLRVHQFNKVELVRFERPEASGAALEELVEHAEEVLKILELPYRVVLLCAGDMGFNAAKCYDLEVWAPAQSRWLEVSSCSNCRDFQARRANIRFKPSGGGKLQFVHTLNGSGLATSRLMVALLENYQTEEGSLIVPPALRPYMDGLSVITRSDP